jgi:hypothetical protein
MKFVKLKDAEHDNYIYLNSDEIVLMCRDEDRTILIAANREFAVKETPEEILKGERYSGWT